MTYYVYTLTDPRESTVIRYVGQTSNVEQRLQLHLNLAKRRPDPDELALWVRSLLSETITPVISVVREYATRTEAIKAEKALQLELLDQKLPLMNVVYTSDKYSAAALQMHAAVRGADGRSTIAVKAGQASGGGNHTWLGVSSEERSRRMRPIAAASNREKNSEGKSVNRVKAGNASSQVRGTCLACGMTTRIPNLMNHQRARESCRDAGWVMISSSSER